MSKYNDIFENLDQAFDNSCKDIPEDIRTQYQRKSIIRWMILMKFLGIGSIHQVIQGEWKSLLSIGKDVL